MLLNQTAEYALRAVAWLAAHDQQSLTNQQLATATQVPAGYLSKVLQSLVRAGLVHSRRGMHGGFQLSRPAAQISVLEAINAVAAMPKLQRCPVHEWCRPGASCRLFARLLQIIALIEKTLGSTSIADITGDPALDRPLCSCRLAGSRGALPPAGRSPAPPDAPLTLPLPPSIAHSGEAAHGRYAHE